MAGGSEELVAEIDAFRQGFGQADSLLTAFRNSTLYVPLTADNRVWSSEVGGIGWVAAFTSQEELARHALARGERTEVRFHTMFGWRIADEVTAAFDHPTGVVVDPSGRDPMAFPPSVEEGR